MNGAASAEKPVGSPTFRNVIRALALHAQRVGAVVASSSTWTRLSRSRGWRRRTTRVHPDKPTLGVRATRPNEIWNVDVSVVRLVDGTRVYLQAIIDNWSRKILALRVSSSFDASATAGLLTEAARFLPGTSRDVVQLFADAAARRVLRQTAQRGRSSFGVPGTHA